ncbi:DNA polymerase III subunit gamma and tau [Nocardia goodfellowii]|uniref:DNA-directed DNA polymerase n=1 Tax=Nocardia goodfellowii TaxID=882446 RepID=A0ABS4Q8H6_9NOCA|nr:DNA polymerase III subunit gamma and tau [Nocardia goodfellowii]MBP2187982.1 DNA polymerase-3 subunit gamma/tau [Nocardia goodfellowii]
MALYRKYRPATFAEVVGQEHVTDPISTALDTGRISHAYLFSGPRGCGKTSSARILARSLNCAEGPTSRPCGVCPSCVALGPGGPGNLDVIELDAASHGGVDDTRELRDRAFYAPAESRYRVFIVDEAHMVTTAGFNALLKIVEEPPAHLIFIFATTEPDKVLPTIRSRTHHYPFRLLPPATMRGLLGKICEQENVAVEEAVYPLVIRAGGGSPRDSLSVLDQLLAGAGPEGVTYNRAVSLLGVTDVALIDDAVEALAVDDGAALFGTVDRVMEAGHDPRRFAVDLLERFRDLILMRAVPDAVERNLVTGPGDVLERMGDQAQRIGAATLARYAELLHEGLGEMRGATAPRLLLEIVCARMLLPSVSDAESATLQRLERLERGIATGAIAPAAGPGPAAHSESGPARPAAAEGRRRGAEALAALRAKQEGAPARSAEPSAQQASAPATPASTQAPSSPQSAPAAGPGSSSETSGPDSAPSARSSASPVQASGPDSISTVHDSASTASAGGPGSDSVPSSRHSASVAPAGGPGQGSASAAPHSASPASAGGPGQDSLPSARSDVSTVQAGGSGPDSGPSAQGSASASGPGHDAASPSRSSGPETGRESTSAAPGPEVARTSASTRGPAESSANPAAAQVNSPSEAIGDAGRGNVAEGVPAPGAQAAAPGSDELLRSVEAAWADIRAKVREFGAAVQALLSGASVARIEGDVIVFAHQHAPLAKRLSEPRNIEAVRSAVRAVLGRDHDIRWEAGAAVARPQAAQVVAKAARAAAQPGQAARGAATTGGPATPPRFSRPSQAKNAQTGGPSAPQPGPEFKPYADDDIPPPDFPDLPDDPGPFDSPPAEPGGETIHAAVPRDLTPEEEQELMAEAAKPVAPEDRRDPDEVALELLRTELGATRIDG